VVRDDVGGQSGGDLVRGHGGIVEPDLIGADLAVHLSISQGGSTTMVRNGPALSSPSRRADSARRAATRAAFSSFLRNLPDLFHLFAHVEIGVCDEGCDHGVPIIVV
jgi:hypothetical protein